MENLFVTGVSHSSCKPNNLLLSPSPHTSSPVKVTVLDFMALMSKCCWVNAWLVSSLSCENIPFRCQTMKLNFQSIMDLIELQWNYAVVMLPSPKILWPVTSVMSSPRSGHVILPQCNRLSVFVFITFCNSVMF